MGRIKQFLLVLMTLMAPLTMAAQNFNDSVKVYFDFGAVFVHTDYMQNKESLDEGIQRIREQQQKGMDISRLVITSSASPEGSEAVNDKMADMRAKALVDYLSSQIAIDPNLIQIDNRRVDWSELKRLAEADKRISKRTRIMRYINKVLRDASAGRPASDATIKANMQNISKDDYNYMRRHLFPKMRYAKAQVEMKQGTHAVSPASQGETVVAGQKTDSVAPATAGYGVTGQGVTYDTICGDEYVLKPGERIVSERVVSVKEYYLMPDGTKIPADVYETWQKSMCQQTTPDRKESPKKQKPAEVVESTDSASTGKPLYLGLKTNLLFDAVLVPNISLEWAFAPQWSVSAEYMHAWWKSDVSHKYWRTYGGNLELRYWFGKKAAQKRLTGHHVGIYGGALTYDFEWGGKGYQAHKWSTNFGVSYGYSAPIAKRLNLDFELGLGYLSGEYEEYEPKGDYYFWEATKNRKFFGPTRAEVTLVWLLGRGNVNRK